MKISQKSYMHGVISGKQWFQERYMYSKQSNTNGRAGITLIAGAGNGAGINRKKRKRGFVLMTMAVASVVLFGCLGLAVDLGRMYIAKNEAQSFADAAALSAALKLDGTSAGVTNAQTAATSLPDYWNFSTTTFTGTTVQVATALAGPWKSAGSPPSPATNYTYVKVTATASVSIYFLPVVTAFTGGGAATSSTINASDRSPAQIAADDVE